MYKWMHKFSFVAVVLAVGVTACQKKASMVVALVNGTAITTDMMRAAYEKAPAVSKRLYDSPRGPVHILDMLISQRVILLQAMKSKGITGDPSAIDPREQQQLVNAYVMNNAIKSMKVTEAEISAAQKNIRNPNVPKNRAGIIAYLKVTKNAEWMARERAKAQIQIDQKALDSFRF